MRAKLIGTFAFIALLFVAVYGFNSPVFHRVGDVVHPLGQWLYGAGVNLRLSITELPSSIGDNLSSEQQAEMNQLRLQQIELERLRAENRQLREELGFTGDYQRDTLPADIVNYQPDSARDMIRINAGSREGVGPGMPVISQESIVGVVDESNERYSTVVLVNDIDFRALVRVGEVSGVLSGQVGGQLLIESIPEQADIEVGDIVRTSGQDGVFPPDLLVGTLSRISEIEGSVFSEAQVDAAVSAQDLQVVMVVRQ